MKRSDIINSFIERYNYKSYLEIGVRRSVENFDKIKVDHKEGVDPNPKAGTCNNIMTSDEFFRKNFQNFDVIFIDGLHLREQVVKDIRNALRCLNDEGVIIIHDCNPPTEFHQREQYEVDGDFPAWNGTTWKAFVDIRMIFSSADIYCVDTDHGCGVIKCGEGFSSTSYSNEKCKYNLKYSHLEADRKNMLNLITVDEFKDKIK